MDKNKLELYKIAMMTSFRREMNGAVAAAMRSGGAVEELQTYGVSTPTIKQITRHYSNNHPLALYIYSSKVRELKIAATFIADKSLISLNELIGWIDTTDNSEVLSHVARLAGESNVAAELFDYLAADASCDKLRPLSLRLAGNIYKRGDKLDSDKLVLLLNHCLISDINSAVYLLNALMHVDLYLFDRIKQLLKDNDNVVSNEIVAFFD